MVARGEGFSRDGGAAGKVIVRWEVGRGVRILAEEGEV